MELDQAARTALESDSPVAAGREQAADGPRLPTFAAPSFSALLQGVLSGELLTVLAQHIRSRRWFRGKARDIQALEVIDKLPLRAAPQDLAVLLVRVFYVAHPPEIYVLPLALTPVGQRSPADATGAALFELAGAQRGLVYDPTGSDELSQLLLQMLVRERTPGEQGHALSRPSAALQARLSPEQAPLLGRVPSGEQSNTCVFFGQELMLKLFRMLEAGENPDVEINEFLWARGYRHVPEPLGSMSYQRADFVSTLGIAQRFLASQGTAWDVTLEILQRSLASARTQSLTRDGLAELPLPSADLLDSSQQTPPQSVVALLGPYAAFARLLGQRTAELHLALASDDHNPAFKPELFSADYQRALVTATRERVVRMYELLTQQLPSVPASVKPLAQQVLSCRDGLIEKLEALSTLQVKASRIRCHGDYHLGQVLCSDDDFIILDFEGEPAQSIESRRLKRSALYDVCGMLRSFHYAATFALQDERWHAEDRAALSGWSEAWYRWASALFLNAYLRSARDSAQPPVFLPDTAAELRALLPLHMIDKCSYELGYELNNRPAWVGVPLAGLLSLSKSR